MKVVSLSPHIHSGNDTSKIMRDVVIALVPTLVFSLYLYKLEALMITAVSVLTCILTEWVINRYLLKKSNTITNWSATVTGVLLAFNLPPSIPLWIVVIGGIVAIGVAKMSYGGLGKNLFNPAIVGRVFLLISFPVQMTSYPDTAGLDAISGATPLSFVKEAVAKGADLTQIMPSDYMTNIVYGFKDGSMGEMGGLLLILGGLYLLFRKVITWHIPVAVLGSMAAFSAILYAVDPTHFINPFFHIFTGGALLGALFMATDYVTSPMNKSGQIIYGIGIGVITILIRVWGAYPEGISFAILIMNAVVPLINMYVKPRRFAK